MVGYNPRCKLCNCEHRAAAEQMHEEGASNQQIADFLAGYDVSISKASVRRHFDTHFTPKDEAAKRYYEQSTAVMEEAVEKRLTDLQMLDEVIQSSYETYQLANRLVKAAMVEEKPVVSMYGKVIMDPNSKEQKPLMEVPGPSKPMVELLNGTKSELRQAIKLKSDLLGEGDDKTVKVMIVDDLDDDS